MEKKNKNKITQGIARVSWLGLVLLGAINLSCGDGDGKSKNGDDKDKAGGSGGDTAGATVDTNKPLQIKLTGITITEDLVARANTAANPGYVLTIEVTDGKDNTADYKLGITVEEYFKEKDFTGQETDATKRVKLTSPANNATLKVLYGGGDELKKGDEFMIPVQFTAGTKVSKGSSRIKVNVVDKSGNSVSNEVSLEWVSET